jgi:hypothetical protein
MGTVPRSPALGSKQFGCVEWSSYLGYPQLAMKTKQLCDTYLCIMSCAENKHGTSHFLLGWNWCSNWKWHLSEKFLHPFVLSFIGSTCTQPDLQPYGAKARTCSYVQIGKTLTKPHRYSKPFGWSFFPGETSLLWRAEILMDDFKIGFKKLPSLCHHFSTDK